MRNVVFRSPKEHSTAGAPQVLSPHFRRPKGYDPGVHGPYVWLQTPAGVSSWDLIDKLLSELHIVGTPDSGFGAAGEGYFRLSAFNSLENTQEAIKRIKKAFA